jgi:hypothetical protein
MSFSYFIFLCIVIGAGLGGLLDQAFTDHNWVLVLKHWSLLVAPLSIGYCVGRFL